MVQAPQYEKLSLHPVLCNAVQGRGFILLTEKVHLLSYSSVFGSRPQDQSPGKACIGVFQYRLIYSEEFSQYQVSDEWKRSSSTSCQEATNGSAERLSTTITDLNLPNLGAGSSAQKLSASI